MKEAKFKLNEEVYAYVATGIYHKGKVVEKGQDEVDRWGDISHWVILHNLQGKQYNVYAKKEVLDKYLDDIEILRAKIKYIENELMKEGLALLSAENSYNQILNEVNSKGEIK